MDNTETAEKKKTDPNSITRIIQENAAKHAKHKNGIRGVLIAPTSRYTAANVAPKCYAANDENQSRDNEFAVGATVVGQVDAEKTDKDDENMKDDENTKDVALARLQDYFKKGGKKLADMEGEDRQAALRVCFNRFLLSTQEAMFLDFIDAFSGIMIADKKDVFLSFETYSSDTTHKVTKFVIEVTFNQFRQMVLGSLIVDDRGEYRRGMYDIIRDSQLGQEIENVFRCKKTQAYLYLSNIGNDRQNYLFDQAVNINRIAGTKKVGDENWDGVLRIEINPNYCPFSYSKRTKRAKKMTAKTNAAIFTVANALAISTYAAWKQRKGELPPLVGVVNEPEDRIPPLKAATIYKYIRLCEYGFQEQKALGLDVEWNKNDNHEKILVLSREAIADVFKDSSVSKCYSDGSIRSVVMKNALYPIKAATNTFLAGAKDLGFFKKVSENGLADKVWLPTKIRTVSDDTNIGEGVIRVLGDNVSRQTGSF